jgi:large subunit ribosomal protein L29
MPPQANLLRALPNEKLQEEVWNTQRELLNLRFRLATRQLSNPGELRLAKRRLAQLLTILRERQLATVETK